MDDIRVKWWIEEGVETCHFCFQHYSYEMEYRCIDCDLPVCPVCVNLNDRQHPLCPGCLDACEEE